VCVCVWCAAHSNTDGGLGVPQPGRKRVIVMAGTPYLDHAGALLRGSAKLQLLRLCRRRACPHAWRTRHRYDTGHSILFLT